MTELERGESDSGDLQEVSILDVLIFVGRHRRLLLATPLVIATAAALVTLALPRTYAATTRILPPQPAQSMAASLVNQAGGGLASLAGGTLLRNPSDLYVGMLQSDSIANELIDRFGLTKSYGKKYRVDAQRALRDDTRFSVDKSGIITIEVDAREPARAAELAGAYVDELQKLTRTLALTDASQRRLFFERLLQQAKEKLADSEVKLRQAIGSGGLVSVDAQGRATVETVARLRAQITAKEVQIGAMQAYATPTHPDVLRAQQEVQSLRRELVRFESGLPAEATADNGPPRGVSNIRLLREVKYNEAMFELLAKQYEIARADESRDTPIVQVLDRAAPPEKASGPRRALLVAAAALGGTLLAVLFALSRDALARAQTSGPLGKLDELRASWRGRGQGAP